MRHGSGYEGNLFSLAVGVVPVNLSVPLNFISCLYFFFLKTPVLSCIDGDKLVLKLTLAAAPDTHHT